MKNNADYINYIEGQLAGIQPFEQKKMFGGIGLFKEGKMFAMIANNTLRLKVDESNKTDFEAYGMTPYHSPSKKKGMPYWEVPIDVIEDLDKLKLWAEKSINIAHSK